MSDKPNKWNPDRFVTARGVFYGRVRYQAGGHLVLRSRSVADRLPGDRVMVGKKLYEVTDMGKTSGGDPKVRLAPVL